MSHGLLVQDRELATARFEPLRGAELEAAIREVKAKHLEDYLNSAEAIDAIPIMGSVHAVLRNGDGEISHESIFSNMVTRLGQEYYGERAAGISSPPDQVTGMRLGTGTGAEAKTGTGSFIGTYATGTHVAITGGYPQSSLPSGSIRRIIWAASWAAGVGTATLGEAVITNETPLTNVAGVEANTIARVVLSPTIAKGASDTLDLTWNHDLGT